VIIFMVRDARKSALLVRDARNGALLTMRFRINAARKNGAAFCWVPLRKI
jgi:hypothetical protein